MTAAVTIILFWASLTTQIRIYANRDMVPGSYRKEKIQSAMQQPS